MKKIVIVFLLVFVTIPTVCQKKSYLEGIWQFDKKNSSPSSGFPDMTTMTFKAGNIWTLKEGENIIEGNYELSTNGNNETELNISYRVNGSKELDKGVEIVCKVLNHSKEILRIGAFYGKGGDDRPEEYSSWNIKKDDLPENMNQSKAYDNSNLYAQEEVKRKDGRTIIIYNNGTWKYKLNTPVVSKPNFNLSENSGNQFVGMWDYIGVARMGTVSGWNIYKDGNLFIMDKISISTYDGTPIVNKSAITATYKDGSLEIDGSGGKINIGTSSGHLFVGGREFKKR